MNSPIFHDCRYLYFLRKESKFWNLSVVLLTSFAMLLGSLGFILSTYMSTEEGRTPQSILVVFPSVAIVVGAIIDVISWLVGWTPQTRDGKSVRPDRAYVLWSILIYGICLIWSFNTS